MGKVYQNLITTTAGFNYPAPQPLDDRLVVETVADLYKGDFVSFAYPGLIVYVTEGDCYYAHTSSESWVKLLDVGAEDVRIPKLLIGDAANSDDILNVADSFCVTQSGDVTHTGTIHTNNLNINGHASIDSTGLHVGPNDELQLTVNQEWAPEINLLGTDYEVNLRSDCIELYDKASDTSNIVINAANGNIDLEGQLTASSSHIGNRLHVGSVTELDCAFNVQDALRVSEGRVVIDNNVAFYGSGVCIGSNEDIQIWISEDDNPEVYISSDDGETRLFGDEIALTVDGLNKTISITSAGNITATENIHAGGVISTDDSIETPAVHVTDKLHVGSVTDDGYLFNVADKLTIGADDTCINVNGISVTHTDDTYDLTLGNNDEFKVNRDETDNTTYVSIVDKAGQMVLSGNALSMNNNEGTESVTLTYEHLKKLIALAADSEKLIALAQLSSVTEQT